MPRLAQHPSLNALCAAIGALQPGADPQPALDYVLELEELANEQERLGGYSERVIRANREDAVLWRAKLIALVPEKTA